MFYKMNLKNTVSFDNIIGDSVVYEPYGKEGATNTLFSLAYPWNQHYLDKIRYT